MSDLIRIDGSYGEGGGQVIRTALALSAITGRPIELANIRGKRAKPGLQAQHLMSVKAAATICQAEVIGDELGSQEIYFSPRSPVKSGNYHFNIGTAGSTTLVLQTIFVPLALAAGRSKVSVTGGTHNPMAPCSDYLERVFLPALTRMGVDTKFELVRAGYFPRGQGEVTCEIEADGFVPISLEERGGHTGSTARVITSGLPKGVGERGRSQLGRSYELSPIEVLDRPSAGAGAAVFVAHEFENAFAGFTGLGERGKPMESVAEEAGKPAADWFKSEATVDEHLADQLVLPAVFAKGQSRWRTSLVTEHLRTVAWLALHFVDREIEIDESTGLVSVR